MKFSTLRSVPEVYAHCKEEEEEFCLCCHKCIHNWSLWTLEFVPLISMLGQGWHSQYLQHVPVLQITCSSVSKIIKACNLVCQMSYHAVEAATDSAYLNQVNLILWWHVQHRQAWLISRVRGTFYTKLVSERCLYAKEWRCWFGDALTSRCSAVITAW